MGVSIDQIDAILPQTQCTKCGYDDCQDYARAIYEGQLHNRCPPGGQAGINALADLLGREHLSLDSSCGLHEPKKVAVIDESLCIGCTKCIQACPVEAIVGANQQMHTIIPDQCTGCDLCIDPCPMDCIDLVTLAKEKQPDHMLTQEVEAQKNEYRRQHQHKVARQHAEKRKQRQTYQQLAQDKADKQAYAAAALAKFRKKRQQSPTSSQ